MLRSSYGELLSACSDDGVNGPGRVLFALRHHAIHPVREPLALDPERPVEARVEVLKGDRHRQLDNLALVEMLAHAREQFVWHVYGRPGNRLRVLEHQALQLIETRR